MGDFQARSPCQIAVRSKIITAQQVEQEKSSSHFTSLGGTDSDWLYENVNITFTLLSFAVNISNGSIVKLQLT